MRLEERNGDGVYSWDTDFDRLDDATRLEL